MDKLPIDCNISPGDGFQSRLQYCESTSVKAFSGLKSATLFSAKSQTLSSVQNGSRVQCMQVWNPIDNINFETLSYLPALSEQDIAKHVDYMIQQKLIPEMADVFCL